MSSPEQKSDNRKQRKLLLKQTALRTAGAMFIMAASGISHQPPRLSALETIDAVRIETDFSFTPPVLPESIAPGSDPKSTPASTPTPESKPLKKDLLREYYAPKTYEEVLKDRELRAIQDPDYLIRTNPEWNKNRITFLISGSRAEDTLTDSIMILSYSLSDHSQDTITIPRDLGTPEVYAITGLPGSARINQAYGLGDMKLTKTIAENVTGLSMDFALKIDLDSFAYLVRTVGSLKINLSKTVQDENYHDTNGIHNPIFFNAGPQEIKELEAVQLARSRGGKDNDDYARSERMRLIASAFLQKVVEEAKKDTSYISNLRGVLEQEIKEGRIKPDFDLGRLFPAMLGPVPIGLLPDLPGLLWTQQFGEGWTFVMPTQNSTGLTRANLIESAGVPGVAIDKLKGADYTTQTPREYYRSSRAFVESFLKRTGGTTFTQR